MADEAEKPVETAPIEPVIAADPVETPVEAVVPVAEAAAVTPAIESKRGRKPKANPTETIPVDVVAEAPAEAVVEAVVPVKVIPAKVTPKVRKVPAAAKPARKATISKAPAPKIVRRKYVATAAPAKIKTTPKTDKNNGVAIPTLSQLKEKLMAKTIPTDFTATIQTAFSDIQEKAKTAYAKSTETLGEATDFAKGNVEAIVESGKILASGLQELGTAAVADSRSAFETLTADVKELASVKSPTEFFQLQSAFLRKSFDNAVASASKSSEAMMKLANEAISPISTRVSLAVEKVSKVA